MGSGYNLLWTRTSSPWQSRPDCNHSRADEDPEAGYYNRCCQDLFGNNAYSDGGVFGRSEGIYISIEAQKSAGGLHAHGQLHVSCMHQHTPLVEIMAQLHGQKTDIVAQYLRYKAHVCREVYEDVDTWDDGLREQIEEA